LAATIQHHTRFLINKTFQRLQTIQNCFKFHFGLVLRFLFSPIAYAMDYGKASLFFSRRLISVPPWRHPGVINQAAAGPPNAQSSRLLITPLESGAILQIAS
jgi:hypothetical protein